MCASMVPMAAEPGIGRAVDGADLARLESYATALADGIEAAIPGWVEDVVARVHIAWAGSIDDDLREEARGAGRRAQAEIAPRVRALLLADIDEQRTNPLAIVRGAVLFPTEVLRVAGVPPVVRDAQAEQHFPADDYDLTPASFTDLDPALHEPGLVWGAAKAHVHLARRRAEGRR